MLDADALVRFEAKFVPEPMSGCWLWLGYIHYGYGQFKLSGRVWQAHRVAFTHFKGEIPEDLVLDHVCRNRACVNPDHLRAVTQWENTHAPGSLCPAKERAARTHCPRGHLLAPPNIVPARLRKGLRECRACGAAHSYARHYKKKGVPLPQSFESRADMYHERYTNSPRR